MRPALVFLVLLSLPHLAPAEPLHQAIDRIIQAERKNLPTAAPADDAEFLRRVYLDLAGTIPTNAELRAFLADSSSDKRTRIIDQLLNAPTYAKRMSEVFHLMFMERLGDHPDWKQYLQDAFSKNKPWNELTADMLRGRPHDPANRGAVFFLSKRLENYGQNPVDYSALTRDIGRLFLGMDLRCAECHDHLFINDYKQADFKGLYAFVQNTALHDAKLPAILEKPLMMKVSFQSVFKKNAHEIGPRIPGRSELSIPKFAKGEEYSIKPDPKTKQPGVPTFSPLNALAEQLPTADNPAFARNAVNRVWFILMGRGLVHPLDLHHSANPPSHPALLDLLAKEFTDHRFDIRHLIREIVLSETYQRSSVLPQGVDQLPPDRFLVALEKRLSAEQLLRSMLRATGEPEPKELSVLEAKFIKAFANPPREPEEEIEPSLRAALFLLNDPTVLGWLTPKPGNLIDRVGKLSDPNALLDELFRSILSRLPTSEERSLFEAHLRKHANQREHAIRTFAWSLLASTEFQVNH